MCGFAGFFDPQNTNEALWSDPDETLSRMTRCIVHRGPDDSGTWHDPDYKVAFGFRRLSILDLTASGHQPMASGSGRYTAVYNGEIYNFSDIKAQLADKGASLRGNSDTEVLLAAIDEWGIEKAISETVGMFAAAIWDKQLRTLHLLRDRLGEKPLYYGLFGNTLIFGSELKALRAHPAWKGEIDRGALTLFLRHNYVPGPYSIYKNVSKVEPGTILSFKAGELNSPQVATYWSVREMVERCYKDQLPGNDTVVMDELERLLLKTIGREMVSDVPLGAFLSGGVDSSLIVALMQAQSSKPVQTFTIGFNEENFNEAQHAQAVADHIGTDHTAVYLSGEETLAVIPEMPGIYDEPFADSSQIPTYLVSKVARTKVSVSLSGEGGDELFAGYNRYFWGERLWNRLRRLPLSARSALGGALTRVSPDRWDSIVGVAGKALPSRYAVINPGHKIHKVAGLVQADSADEMYRLSMSHWHHPSAITGVPEPEMAITSANRGISLSEVPLRMMYFDMISELPDDILVKVDRAGMAASLETRAPLLDHTIVEYAWRIPLSMKIREGKGKWILRELLYRYVPQHLIDRPKMGFGVPIDAWLRGPLKVWAADLLAQETLARQRYLDPDIIWKAWNEHQSGKTDHSHKLWGVLMFQAWLQEAESA